MTFNRQKAWGWVGIAAFAAAGLFVLKDKSASQLGLAAAIFLVSLTIVGAAVVAAFLAREGLGRLWKRQFPPPPLWEKPRPVSALFEAELFAPLKLRLDLLEEDGRAGLCATGKPASSGAPSTGTLNSRKRRFSPPSPAGKTGAATPIRRPA